MKKTLLAAALAMVSAPVLAGDPTPVNSQITDAVTKAATDAATKAITGKDSDRKAKKDKGQKDGPNYGNSLEHRQDDQGHKGKSKK